MGVGEESSDEGKIERKRQKEGEMISVTNPHSLSSLGDKVWSCSPLTPPVPSLSLSP